MGRIFATTSGKGGVGKSSVSVGLAFAFCRTGKKVLLVDMDEGLRCLDILLGVDSSAVLDLCDVLNGANPQDAAYRCNEENLELITAPAKFGSVDGEKFSEFVRKTEPFYDVIIFDFPAGIDLKLYACLPPKTVFLTVAVPDPVSVRDAAAISGKLKEMSLKSRLIINRFDYKKCLKYKTKNIDEIIDNSRLRLLGLVPESDEILMLSLNHRIKKRGKTARAFYRISQRLFGNAIPLPKLKKI